MTYVAQLHCMLICTVLAHPTIKHMTTQLSSMLVVIPLGEETLYSHQHFCAYF